MNQSSYIKKTSFNSNSNFSISSNDSKRNFILNKKNAIMSVFNQLKKPITDIYIQGDTWYVDL
jgi:hypothetical protein